MKIDKSTLKKLIKEEIEEIKGGPEGLAGSDEISELRELLTVIMKSINSSFNLKLQEKEVRQIAGAAASTIGREFRVEQKHKK